MVCQGAFILNRDYYLHDWFALDDMTAQSFKASRDFKLCIGQYKGVDCEVWNLKNVEIQLNNLMLVELREVLISCSALSFAAVCRSSQLVSWHKTNKFCGRCGKKNTISSTEHCFLCSHCNLTNYPKISPCIIVVVINEDKCLLARQPSWPKGMYSALAGFIEAGESAEEAIRREIIEEVGILVLTCIISVVKVGRFQVNLCWDTSRMQNLIN